MKIEKWKTCWRENVAPNLTTKGLKGLLTALIDCDQNLVKGLIVGKSNKCYSPAAKPVVGCAIGYSMIKSGYRTCLSIHNKYAKLRNISDFTFWFDHTPIEEIRIELVKEVRKTLSKRFCK